MVTYRKKTGTDIDSLIEAARKLGLEEDVNKIISKKTKLSALQRLSAGFSALNPAQAVSVGREQGLGAGILEYPKSIARGLGSAITGTDYQPKRKYFKDIAEDLGVEKGIAKFGIGFLGDVLLDPSTYFGGAIARVLGTGVRVGAKMATKGVSRVAPGVGENLFKLGDSLQDSMGKAFVAGYKTTEGLKSRVLQIAGKKSQAIEKTAQEQFSKLGTGLLSTDQNTEVWLRMMGGKRFERVLRASGKTAQEAGEMSTKQALEGATGQVRKTIESLQARAAERGQVMFGDDFYRSYIPSLRKDKLEKIFGELDRSGLRMGSQQYTKQFKNLLTNEELEQNVAKLFFSVDSQIAANKIIKEGLEEIAGTMGKPLTAFKNESDALANGYKILRTQGVFGKELGYVSKWDWEFITGQLDGGFKTIDMIAKASGFDAITSLFKRSVTGLFAPFHIRNFVSGLVQNFEALGKDALNPQNIYSGQKLALAAIRGTKLSGGLGKALQPFIDRFKHSSFYTNEFDSVLKSGQTLDDYVKWYSKSNMLKTAKSLGTSENSPWFRAGRAVGNYIELQQKGTAYVTAIGQGKTIEQALALAEKAGFDYRVLTKFESSILRRIVPFYSFTRKNVELQLRTMGENPQRINQIIRLIENIGERPSEEEKEGLPEYIKEGFAVKLPDTAEGLKQYLSSLGTPIEQFAGLFKPNVILSTISTMNPIIKAPIELGIGKDSFRQKDLKEVYNAKEYALAPQIIKDLLEIKEVEKPIYKRFGDKLVKTGTRKEYIADPDKLLIARSLFTSRGVSYLDQIFNHDIKGFTKLMKLFSGLKPQEVNIEITKALKDKETKRALEDLLIKMGEYKRYESVYRPKQ